MRVSGFEWDDGNILQLALGHGIEPEEAEEAFALAPLVRRTKRKHYALFGRTLCGRLIVVVFEKKLCGIVRVITAWDMTTAERRYWERHRRKTR